MVLNLIPQSTVIPTGNEKSPDQISSLQTGSSDFDAFKRTRSTRLIRPRVDSDTISEEWWKRPRVQDSNSRVESSNTTHVTDEESALVSGLEIPEPKSFDEAKHSTY
ncbi:hypothetical protein K3495_g5961 [Podosphaera aphanis]|nr:hypothetical protein K3495_g5961 [Podosphaera aphanis]